MTEPLRPEARQPKVVFSATAAGHSEGMSYLASLPRRLVTIYLPLRSS